MGLAYSMGMSTVLDRDALDPARAEEIKRKVTTAVRGIYPEADTSRLELSSGSIRGPIIDSAFAAEVPFALVSRLWIEIDRVLGKDSRYVSLILPSPPDEAVPAP